MRSIKLYPVKIIFAFLFIFCLLGTELTLFAKYTALNPAIFEKVVESEQLEEKTYTTLENYFQTRSNSTGIPASVYLTAIDKNNLKQGTLTSVSNAFDYVNQKSDDYQFTMDFTALENSITEFFSNYADENNFEKDDIYQQKVNSTIQEAEKEILFMTDTFKFSTIYENGWLAKAKNYMSIFNKISMLLIIITIIIFILLFTFCVKQITEILYWTGISGFISGLLLLLPCLYLKTTDYVSGFVIKDQQIFSAVVGYLHILTNQAILLSAMTLLIGALFLIIFGFLQKRKQD